MKWVAWFAELLVTNKLLYNLRICSVHSGIVMHAADSLVSHCTLILTKFHSTSCLLQLEVGYLSKS